MKKNYKKIIILVLLLIQCIGLYKICNAETTNNLTLNNIKNKDRLEKIKEKGVLTVVTSEPAPFAFLDPKTNRHVGIDMDIINEFAKELGINKVDVKVVPFENLFDTLNNDDTVDIAASGITITNKRKELVNFTDPLYKESEAIIIPKVSKINFKEDLKNSTIGVKNGTVYINLAENWKKEGKIRDFIKFDTTPELLSAVSSNKIDAALMDSIVAEYTLFTEDPYLKIMYPYTPEDPGVIGIAVRKDDISLLNTLNSKIDNMKKFKIINKILENYGIRDAHLVSYIK